MFVTLEYTALKEMKEVDTDQQHTPKEVMSFFSSSNT